MKSGNQEAHDAAFASHISRCLRSGEYIHGINQVTRGEERGETQKRRRRRRRLEQKGEEEREEALFCAPLKAWRIAVRRKMGKV